MRVGDHGQAFSAALRCAIDDSGLPIAEVARRSGLHRARLNEALRGDRHLPVAWLPQLPAEVLRPLLERLASRLGLGLTELPEAAEHVSDARSLAVALRECSDVTTAYAHAIADGHLLASEASIVVREVDEAIAALLAIKQRAELARRERVIGLQ